MKKYGFIYFSVNGEKMTLGNVVIKYDIPSTELAVSLEGEPVEYFRGGKVITVTKLPDTE